MILRAAIAGATPALFATGAPAGSLITTLAGVPSGTTPTFTPSDGRVVVAGSEATGWKLVVGLTASSAGTISGTVTAGAASGSVAITVAAGAVLADPAEFAARWPSSPNVRELGSTYAVDFDITSLIPVSPTATYYVNFTSGNDASAGTSTGTAWKTASKVYSYINANHAAADSIVIRCSGTASRAIRGADNFTNVAPIPSVYWINTTPQYRFRFTAGDIVTTWALDGTTGLYNVTKAATASRGVVFLGIEATPVNPDTGLAIPNTATAYKVATKVADLATCQTTPFSYYHDGTKLWLNSGGVDAVAQNATILVGTATANGLCKQTAGTTYFSGFDFLLGDIPFKAQVSVSGATVAYDRCTFQGSNPEAVSNGLSVLGPLTVYARQCGAYFNATDGFNYHSGVASQGQPSAATDSPKVLELECASMGNGATGAGDTTSNASTCHDYCAVKRVNCIYPDSYGLIVGESNDAMSVNYGIVAGVRQNGPSGAAEAFGISGNVKTWLAGCRPKKPASGIFVHVSAGSSTTAAYLHNMPAVTTSGPGTIGAW